MSLPPLSNIKVIDLTRARAGPTCVRHLADMGAQVVKVENPSQHAGLGRHHFDFQNLHRNKRSIAVNLKHAGGVGVIKRMAKDADVLVENYRPGVKHRLGIDYETLRPLNPRLIYASISGFGQSGPYADRPGVDQIAQGMGGLMSVTGMPGSGPVRVGIPVADLTSGMFLAMGVLSALYERERSGEGQWIHTSLLEAMVQMLDFQATRWLIGEEVPPQAGNNHPTGVPTNTFRARDGYLNIAPAGQDMYQRFCKAIEREDLLSNPDYQTGRQRFRSMRALLADIDDTLKSQPSDYWMPRLDEHRCIWAPINDTAQAAQDPQVRATGAFETIHHPEAGDFETIAAPFRMHNSPGVGVRGPAPRAGEHTAAVLGDLLGLDEREINDLAERGVVSSD